MGKTRPLSEKAKAYCGRSKNPSILESLREQDRGLADDVEIVLRQYASGELKLDKQTGKGFASISELNRFLKEEAGINWSDSALRRTVRGFAK